MPPATTTTLWLRDGRPLHLRRAARRHRRARSAARGRDDRRDRRRPARARALPRRPPRASSLASTIPATCRARRARRRARRPADRAADRPRPRRCSPGARRARARARAAARSRDVPTRRRQVPRASALRRARHRRRPPSWLPDDVPDDARFPLLVKVREGFGSRHIYRALDRERARLLPPLHARSTRSCRSAAAGEEFSIDVFCDLDSRCLNAIPRTMIQSKGGESIKGMTIKDGELIEHGRSVAETIGIVGPANIQCFREPDGTLPRDRHQPALRRRVPAAARGRQPLPRAGARARRTASGPSRGSATSATGSLMTRFFSHLVLAPDGDGVLEPYAEELPSRSPPTRAGSWPCATSSPARPASSARTSPRRSPRPATRSSGSTASPTTTTRR